MSKANNAFLSTSRCYLNKLNNCFTEEILEKIHTLALRLLKSWEQKKQVFLCGNGGSAANAIHLSNDLIYGVGACGEAPHIPGLKVETLTANSGILTCLANDTGYENIFSYQLEAKANPGDIIIVLSGSGNSPNIVNALLTSRKLGLESHAILGFNGGKCKHLADNPIHFNINDMQIAEDTQLIVGHLCMQWLNQNKPSTIHKLC